MFEPSRTKTEVLILILMDVPFRESFEAAKKDLAYLVLILILMDVPFRVKKRETEPK